MKTKKFKLGLLLLIIIIGTGQWSNAVSQQESDHDPLEYNVSVSAMLMPVFAVDAKGDPVYDLQSNELELYINGKSTPFELTRYQFEEAPEDAPEVEPEKRVVFIILDAIFNSLEGFKRGKAMAKELTKEGSKDNLYILLQITPVGGIEYITGPEPYSEELEKKIEKIDITGSFFKNNLFQRKRTPDSLNFDLDDPRNNRWDDGVWNMHRQSKVKMHSMQYSITIRRFVYLLSQFQHALRTITKPKVVFLISEGISRKAFESEVPSFDGSSGDWASGGQEPMTTNNDDNNSFYDVAQTSIALSGNISNFHLKYLKEIARSINLGGSVLYAVNPRRSSRGEIDPTGSGDMSLNYLARQSGGKYFQGTDVKAVMTNIKRTTAAYYELSFAFGAIKGKNLDIKIKSKRKGIDILTLRHATKGNPYHAMSKIEKKIFALNVINGGTWSRMVGNVKPAKLRYLKTKKTKKAILRQVEIKIPEEMRNKKADLFLIETDLKTKKNDIKILKQTLNKPTQLVNLKKSTSRDVLQYLVFIEPQTPNCIFTLVK